jgi:hypothetical protein
MKLERQPDMMLVVRNTRMNWIPRHAEMPYEVMGVLCVISERSEIVTRHRTSGFAIASPKLYLPDEETTTERPWVAMSRGYSMQSGRRAVAWPLYLVTCLKGMR